MTTTQYQQAAETFREIREEFYRTRLQRGERLSLSEAGFLAERHGVRLRQGLQGILANSKGFPVDVIAAVAEFAKAVRGLQEMMDSSRTFPRGGLSTNN